MSDYKYIIKNINGDDFYFTEAKCIYWSRRKCLIMTDTEFGKASSFNKFGITAQMESLRNGLTHIKSLVSYFEVQQVLFLGNMFHSLHQAEMEYWQKWEQTFSNTDFTLIKSKNEAMTKHIAQNMKINLATDIYLQIDNFVFVHDITTIEKIETHLFYFSGHAHPGLKTSGKSHQQQVLPCYFFDQNICILPAFSQNASIISVTPEPGNQFIIVSSSNLWEINPFLTVDNF